MTDTEPLVLAVVIDTIPYVTVAKRNKLYSVVMLDATFNMQDMSKDKDMKKATICR